MRKQFGVISSLILCATALFWMGCNRGGYDCCQDYGYDGYDGYAGSYDGGFAYGGYDSGFSGGYDNSFNGGYAYEGGYDMGNGVSPQQSCGGDRVTGSTICCEGVQVTARQPQMCLLGDQYALDICVDACRDVCDVTISTTLPDGVQFVRSEPDAFVDGQKLVWTLPSMKAGTSRGIRILLRCEREGDLCTCFCVQATPVAFCTILCAKPVLHCEKCGPEEACPGDCLNYTITVSNKGSCTAHDVVVTDNIPDGLEHVSGQNCLTFKIGDLAPCQSKCLNVTLRACKRGRVCNSAIVTACNADQTSCEACTTICKYCCEVSKEGPKEVRIGQNAEYNIVVTNVGDRPITDVHVTDIAPSNTSIVAAEGAHICENRAVWRIEEIRPGEDVTLPITLTSCSPGYYCNRVSVTNAQGCCCHDEFATRWRGTPALNCCVYDLEDPICIGETTSYKIKVVNQGSEPDQNVRITVRFPSQIVPTSAVGASSGQVSGQTVTFAPYRELAPRQTIEYRVDARAKESGDARVKVEVMSDSITTPIVQEESTIVN